MRASGGASERPRSHLNSPMRIRGCSNAGSERDDPAEAGAKGRRGEKPSNPSLAVRPRNGRRLAPIWRREGFWRRRPRRWRQLYAGELGQAWASPEAGAGLTRNDPAEAGPSFAGQECPLTIPSAPPLGG